MFSVNPDKMTIPSKTSCQLELFGFSAQPGQLEEHFVCTLGGGVKAKHVVFDFDVRCILLPFLCTLISTLHCNVSCAV